MPSLMGGWGNSPVELRFAAMSFYCLLCSRSLVHSYSYRNHRFVIILFHLVFMYQVINSWLLVQPTSYFLTETWLETLDPLAELWGLPDALPGDLLVIWTVLIKFYPVGFTIWWYPSTFNSRWPLPKWVVNSDFLEVIILYVLVRISAFI